VRAVAIYQFGGAEELKLVDLPRPEPTETEVLVAVEYAGVNPVDWKIRRGYLKARGLPYQFPIVLGWDAAGTVVEIGRKVSRFKKGDKVFAYCRKPVVQWGAYAEQIALDEGSVARMPTNLSFAQAAGVPLAGLTAWQSLFEAAQLKGGESILIHAGAGGVGGYAIQFARVKGARIYTTASAKNHDYVKGLGADRAIDYTRQDFVEVMKDWEPKGVDVVYDTVGGETERQSLAVLKPGGRLVGIVQQPNQTEADVRKIQTFYVFVRPDGSQLAEIAALFEKGVVRPPEVLEMKLEEAARAHQLSEGRHVRGKIVLKVR
jgi:NADPH2:quinone reductase